MCVCNKYVRHKCKKIGYYTFIYIYVGTPVVYDYLVPAHIHARIDYAVIFFHAHSAILYTYLLYSVDRSSACDWSMLLMLKIIHFARVPLP